MIRKSRSLIDQKGAAFVTGLIFLAVLTLLGVSAMRMSIMEERMSGNMRDRVLAMRAAEMGLRYAEQHIRDNDPDTNTPQPIDGITDFDTTCTGGVCYYGAGVSPPATAAWITYCTPNCPINYVEQTVFRTNGMEYRAPALPRGVPPPTYLIEGIQKTPPGNSMRYYYRITIRAQGAKPGTVVWLQEVFRP